MIKLNLGGGSSWNEIGWENLDIARGYDLKQKQLKEYEDNSVDLIYSSHNIEHIEWPYIDTYMKMVYRVLKPTGTFRLTFPDVDIMWDILKNKDKKRMLDNTNYFNNPEMIARDVIFDIRAIFGYNKDGSKLFSNESIHFSLWNESILGIIATNAGFKKIIKKKGPNDSEIKDFKLVAKYFRNRFVGGFDNQDTKSITSYFELQK